MDSNPGLKGRFAQGEPYNLVKPIFLSDQYY